MIKKYINRLNLVISNQDISHGYTNNLEFFWIYS